MKSVLLFFASILAAVALTTSGCHAQVAATTHKVVMTWTAASGCTTSTCTYLVSRVTVTSGTTSCPTATTGTYTAINSSAEVTASTYTDSGAAGLTVCYVVQTDLSAAYSVASNTAGPLVVPANPTAPTNASGTQSTTTASNQETPLAPTTETAATQPVQVADAKIAAPVHLALAVR